MNLKQCNIGNAIKECAELMEFKASAKGLILSHNIEDTLQEFTTDEPRMRQILINLIANAIKFTMKGSVSVTADLH